MRHTITLDDLDPAMLVSANRRIHHHVRAKVCRYWRELGAIHGRSVPGRPWERAHITVTFRYPDRRRRDTPNLYSYVVKPLVDGLVTDAHVLLDDDDKHLIGPDIRREPLRGTLQIVVEIVEISAEVSP